MEEIKETCYKGTRILVGNYKRDLLNMMIEQLRGDKFMEISLPIIQHQEMFAGKVGQENLSLMFNFKDRGERNLCLAPEYTAVMQQLAKTTFSNEKDLKLFYIQECFRGEKPQAGRYRQFTQLGVEILNPTDKYKDMLSLGRYAHDLIHWYMNYKVTVDELHLNLGVTRGIDYYKEGKGFEITCDKLGAQKQVCGGGEYDGGVGFAIGIDRLLCI